LFNYLDTIIFHAGTSFKEGKLVTSGGRVLAVTGVASTLRNAVDKAYECVKAISFENMYYRKDIAHRYKIFGLCLIFLTFIVYDFSKISIWHLLTVLNIFIIFN
jgi:hypothetical protein